MNDWELLGLEAPTDDVPSIKRAYALKLRVTRPDDDAAAYQALREAYDRLMQRARWAKVPAPAPVEPPAAEPPLPVPAPPQALPPSPALLCERLLDCCGHGRFSRAALEAIRLQLHELPLSQQHEASIRFAELVIAHPMLPLEAKQMLKAHFEWLDDFRLARQLGPQRAEALMAALPPTVRPITDPQILSDFAELRGLNERLAQEATPWSTLTLIWIAALLGPLLERRLFGTHPQLLQRLGFDERVLRAIDRKRLRGQQLRQVVPYLSVGLVGWAITLETGQLWRGIFLGALLGGIVPRLLLWPLRYLAWIRQLELQPEPRWLAGLRRVVKPQHWPWVGIAVIVACLAALPYAVDMFADEPLTVFVVALGIVLLGSALALPASAAQSLSTLALLAYTVAAVGNTQTWVTGLCAAWVLGGTQLYLNGTIDPAAAFGPTRRGVPRIVLMTIGLPAYIAWLSDHAGDGNTIAALLLAWSPHFFPGNPIDSPLSPWPMAVGMLSLLVWLQGKAMAWGRRLLARD